MSRAPETVKICPHCFVREADETALVCRSCGFRFERPVKARAVRRFDRLALLTFVLAMLWLFGIGSLLALVVGGWSLRRMKAEPDLRGRTVAWAGIAVAVFGIALAGLALGVSLAA
jgi:hypothetical protein